MISVFILAMSVQWLLQHRVKTEESAGWELQKLLWPCQAGTQIPGIKPRLLISAAYCQ